MQSIKQKQNVSLYQILKPLSAKFIKWSNTLKQIVGRLPTICLSVFDHFSGLAFKGLKSIYCAYLSCHTYVFRKPSFWNYLNVNSLFARNKHDIKSLGKHTILIFLQTTEIKCFMSLHHISPNNFKITSHKQYSLIENGHCNSALSKNIQKHSFEDNLQNRCS